MELILWRHAEAEDGAGMPDMERRLTRHGHKQAEKMAAWIKPRLPKDCRVVVSPSKRTLETVDPLGVNFETDPRVAPGVSARGVLDAADWPDSPVPVLVVGHQPTLGEVAAQLLGGAEGEVAIRKGAVWWFTTRSRHGQRDTVLTAVVNPDFAQA